MNGRMSAEGRAIRNLLAEALLEDYPALSRHVRRCLPSTYVNDDTNTLILRFGPGAKMDKRRCEDKRGLLADALVALGDPDTPPLGVRFEQVQ